MTAEEIRSLKPSLAALLNEATSAEQGQAVLLGGIVDMLSEIAAQLAELNEWHRRPKYLNELIDAQQRGR